MSMPPAKGLKAQAYPDTRYGRFCEEHPLADTRYDLGIRIASHLKARREPGGLDDRLHPRGRRLRASETVIDHFPASG